MLFLTLFCREGGNLSELGKPLVAMVFLALWRYLPRHQFPPFLPSTKVMSSAPTSISGNVRIES